MHLDMKWFTTIPHFPITFPLRRHIFYDRVENEINKRTYNPVRVAPARILSIFYFIDFCSARLAQAIDTVSSFVGMYVSRVWAKKETVGWHGTHDLQLQPKVLRRAIIFLESFLGVSFCYFYISFDILSVYLQTQLFGNIRYIGRALQFLLS